MIDLTQFQRQNKFRLWFAKDQRWIHGPHKDNSLDGVNLLGETIILGSILCMPDDNHVSIEDLNDVVTLEYTGLDDDDGKNIFEGDIVEETWEECHLYGYSPDEYIKKKDVYIVEYKAPSFVFKRRGDSQTSIEHFSRRVIGNIFDSPELIK
jgi:uncharacterized phage protein (TIGR01671 family)